MAWEWLATNWRLLLVLVLVVTALTLFFFETFPIEVTSLGVLVVLAGSGILDTKQAYSGFSNPATLTVLMMFILSAAILQSGIIDLLGDRLARWFGESVTWQVLLVGVIIAPISAFINNTAAVAVFIPLVLNLTSKVGRSPSKVLMPLSFAAMLGGTMTLIGTSTNLLASELRAEAGLGSFSMFEFTKAGILVFLVGMLYITLLGHRLLPRRLEGRALDERWHLREFVFEVDVPPKSGLVGKPLGQSFLVEEYDADVLRLIRANETLPLRGASQVYQEGDRLLVRSTRDSVQRMADRGMVVLRPVNTTKPEAETMTEGEFAELVVFPGSTANGKRLGQLDIFARHGVHCVGLLSKGRTVDRGLYSHRLRIGDVLLVMGDPRDLGVLTGGDEFQVLGGPAPPLRRPHKIPLVLLTLVAVVGIAAVGWAPIVLTATAGVVFLVMAGALRLGEMYASIHWDVIFLLAGIIPLGLALTEVGATKLLVDLVASWAGVLHPVVLLGVVYGVATLLTEVVSNNASVVLLVPFGIQLALTLGYNPTTFVLAIMFAASTSFLTPIGYQTNLMVMSPGGYRYSDYLRMGLPLNAVLVVATPLILSYFWPIV